MPPHPLRGQAMGAELAYISSLGNVDPDADRAQHAGRRAAQQKRPEGMAPMKKINVAALKNEDGEAIDDAQKKAITQAIEQIEQQVMAAFFRRDACSNRIAVIAKALAEKSTELAGVEREMMQGDARVKATVRELKRSQDAREKDAAHLEIMRAENEEIKNRTLTDMEMHSKVLRQAVKDADRAVRAAIWSAGAGDGFTIVGVGADTPLPDIEPVEPIIINAKKWDEAGSAVGSIRGRRSPTKANAQSFGIKKYEMHASMDLKDPSELSFKHAEPLQILQSHSTGSTRGTEVFASLIARESDLIQAGQRSILGDALPPDTLRSLVRSPVPRRRSVQSPLRPRRSVTPGRY